MDGQSRHESHITSNTETLFTLLLGVSEQHILNLLNIELCPLNKCFNDSYRQIVAANRSKKASLGMSSAYRRPRTINNNGTVHFRRPHQYENIMKWGSQASFYYTDSSLL